MKVKRVKSIAVMTYEVELEDTQRHRMFLGANALVKVQQDTEVWDTMLRFFTEDEIYGLGVLIQLGQDIGGTA